MKTVRNICAAGAVLLGAALLSGCDNVKISVNFRKPVPEKLPVRVKVEAVGSASSATTKTYVGRVEASKSTTVLSPFPAELEKINVQQGQTVRANQQVAKVYSAAVASTLSTMQV